MADAIELAQFYLGEAKRLSEAATISAEVESAERLRVWLLASWPSIAKTHNRDPQNVVPRDVVQWGPGSMRETAKVKKLIAILVSHGWLVQLETGAVIDGKSRQLAYRIARAA